MWFVRYHGNSHSVVERHFHYHHRHQFLFFISLSLLPPSHPPLPLSSSLSSSSSTVLFISYFSSTLLLCLFLLLLPSDPFSSSCFSHFSFLSSTSFLSFCLLPQKGQAIDKLEYGIIYVARDYPKWQQTVLIKLKELYNKVEYKIF